MTELANVTFPEYDKEGIYKGDYNMIIMYEPFVKVEDVIERIKYVYDIDNMDGLSFKYKKIHDIPTIDMTINIERLLKIKEQISYAIDNCKTIKFINDYIRIKNNNAFPFYTKNYLPDDEEIFENVNKQFDILREANKVNERQHNQYIKSNVNEIFDVIDNMLLEYRNKKKLARKITNQKYYLKCKELNAIVDNIEENKKNSIVDNIVENIKTKTEEDYKNKRKEYNRKYYLKHRKQNIIKTDTL